MQLSPTPPKSGSYLWSRHVNTERELSMLLFIHTNTNFLQLWPLKCDQQLDMSQPELNYSRAIMGNSYKLIIQYIRASTNFFHGN